MTTPAPRRVGRGRDGLGGNGRRRPARRLALAAALTGLTVAAVIATAPAASADANGDNGSAAAGHARRTAPAPAAVAPPTGTAPRTPAQSAEETTAKRPQASGSQTSARRPTGSQATGSQATGSQATGSQATGTNAPGTSPAGNGPEETGTGDTGAGETTGAASASTAPAPSSGVGVPPVPAGGSSAGDGADGTAQGVDQEVTGERRPYQGDPEAESALVEREDDRLAEARTVASLSRWSKVQLISPYRIAGNGSYTLVLTTRETPYTIEDLLKLAPQTFVRQTDGAYLLSENIVIEAGAVLKLQAPTRLVIKLASDAKGFVSIVNYGGRLEIAGTDATPVQITSWDRANAKPDTTTTDGRGYLRSLGGQVDFQHVTFEQLGFWSGRTGGVSLTGTDRPTPGALDRTGKDIGEQQRKERGAATPPGTGTPGQPGTDQTGSTAAGSKDKVAPAGKIEIPEVSGDQPEYSYVSAAISDATFSDNVFGLFLSGANGVDIRNSTVQRSQVDGIVLHRYVTNMVLQSSVTQDNAGDGVILSRATTGVVLSEVTAQRNSRNGLSMIGLPLATGPSATGTATGDYGNNSVVSGRFTSNGRYGIEVIGGRTIGVQANVVSGNAMGVVVRTGANGVRVVGNQVTGSAKQGIVVRDQVSGAVVTGNSVDGGRTSVYVRDGSAAVERNTLTNAELHAVSLIGSVRGSTVMNNTIAGKGPSAVDAARSTGADTRSFVNNTDGWSDTTPWWVTLKKYLQPMTMIWLALLSLLLITALRGLRARRQQRHPYADKRAVTTDDDVVLPAPPGAPMPLHPPRPAQSLRPAGAGIAGRVR